ncbi:flagellar basal body rod protein FlgC [Aestuariispira insulae]|uniref:Flagellar basal-body rod protein FlgC n=1 Tax=Aestuariispira insulae TaxID=1461337 RepID=A0A3D9HSK5_9PROT|nr:flagellar basal body rod protein FlgC [Aestuariispira insulae]RED52474.1 flagellar basal-body rod protein FlgC [Aestuariispira insulae]
MDQLKSSFYIAGSGMRAQGTRLRVISENIANKDSTAETAGGDPYRRKVVTFKNVLDREIGAELVRPTKISEDLSSFTLQYDPGHPAADETGYYKRPNVKGLVEMMDMREAQRSYEANLNVIQSTKSMVDRTIDLLK